MELASGNHLQANITWGQGQTKYNSIYMWSKEYNNSIYMWSKEYNNSIYMWSKEYNNSIYMWSKEYNNSIYMWSKEYNINNHIKNIYTSISTNKYMYTRS